MDVPSMASVSKFIENQNTQKYANEHLHRILTKELKANSESNWSLYLDISKELPSAYDDKSPKKIELGQRENFISDFMKWLHDHGAEFNGIEIAQFDQFEYGLQATKDHEQNSLIITIPQKIIMTEQDAWNSQLQQFLSSIPFMKKMPNIALALYVLYELFNSESIWKPYLNILPRKYSTVLYLSDEELQALNPSPVFDEAVNLVIFMKRLYAYFYNHLCLNQSKYTEGIRQRFTYDNFRWAISTVMTRQNKIILSGGSTIALIPLWDMCNHEQGEITTGFDPDLGRADCYAHRDFKAGEQIFIFYGVRTNAEFFLNNGFVVENNKHDYTTVFLGVSKSDVLYKDKCQFLTALNIGPSGKFKVHVGDKPISKEMLAFVRVFNMAKEDLEKWNSTEMKDQWQQLFLIDSTASKVIGCQLETKTLKYMKTRFELLLLGYKKNEAKSANACQMVQSLKESEKKILQNAIEYTKTLIDDMSKKEC